MYVIYCLCGRESLVTEQLRRKGAAAYSPRRLVKERRRGQWYSREDVLFDGYVFLDSAELPPELYYTVKGCDGVIRLVSREPLSEDEEKYIRTLCSGGECIGVSRGYVRDGRLHITEGFLKALEHRITRFNRRGRRAEADVTMYGENYHVRFTVEFDPPPELP